MLAEQLTYWKEQLAGSLPVLELPRDYACPTDQPITSGSLSVQLSEDLSQVLRGFSQRERVTSFMTLLATFKTLLYRITGQEDLIVGTPVTGRNPAEREGLTGFCATQAWRVNTLVLRTDLSTNTQGARCPTFRELLGRVRQVALDAYAHQDVPFEKVVEELQPERDLSRSSIFQVWVEMGDLDSQPLDLAGLTVESLKVDQPSAKFDLRPKGKTRKPHSQEHTPSPSQEGSFGLTPLLRGGGGVFFGVRLFPFGDLSLYISDGERIELKLVYNADLFGSPRMAQLLGQFEYLLEQVVANSTLPINAYSLVTEEASVRLPDPSAVLAEPTHEPITNLITYWAKQHPLQPAIEWDGHTFNYHQLVERAEGIAQLLLTHGLERGDVVAVYGTRSFELIASLIGVLLSGGVFLTLDPNLPRGRLLLMQQEAQAKFLLHSSQENGLSRLSEREGCQVIEVAAEYEANRSPVVPLPTLSPEDPAYIFFTSGTTGIPKGVLGCHKGLAHFLSWQRQTFEVGLSDRSGQLTALSFDVVLRDIFLPLTSGATLVLPTSAYQVATPQILSWLEEKQITLLHTVPSLAKSWLVEVPSGVSLQALRCLFFAGEPLTEQLIGRWRQAFPHSGALINLYGPTETTMAKFCYRVPTAAQPGVQPVGYPLPQTQALVLNNNQLCGYGEPGEIVIRTPFRTLGYINRTNERFVKNPFSGDDQDLLYYTGDLGRYRPDGALEILGRKDHQIKIRGIRIELSEIEAVLNNHPAVTESVVIAHESEGNKRLVAYLVASEPTNSRELRHFLTRTLPNYMIPTAFMRLDRLPLTANGKIDRRALPEPSLSREMFVAPRTPTEVRLAAIWSEALGVTKVGVTEHFLELGGHSLLATQIISRVRDAFRVELPLRSLFDSPTVASLASQIENAAPKHALATKALPPIEAVSRDEPLPVSFSQLRLWFLEQLEGSNAAYNIPLTRHLAGELNIGALQQSLSEVVRRHESLRTTFTFLDGSPKQVIHPPTPLSLPVVDLTELTAREREATTRRLQQQEAQRPFDLSDGPLLRVTLLKLTTEEHILLCTMHHIISDAWSSDIFSREVFALYDAYAQNKPTGLPTLPIQYADFACWQQERLDKELSRQLVYWKEHLAGDLPILDLPRDYARPTRQAFTSGTLSIKLSEELSEGLSLLSRQEGATLFMTLLAGFKTLLYRYTGQEDIIVGTPIAGRNRAELEGLIGFFISTLVLRCDLSANPTFRELLGRVRQVALDAYAHQDVPFEKLVEELQPERDLSRTPIFQVWVNMFNPTTSRSQQVAGLTVERSEQGERQAKFDLSLYISAGRATQAWRGIELELVYNAHLFSEARIEVMLTHLQTLLAGIVAAPDAPISSYRLPPARGQNLVQPSNPFIEFPVEAIEQSIPSRFAEQVSRYPDNLAIKTKRYAWTYRQLNEQANHIAQAILDQESGAGRIALLFEHDAPMIAGMLGVLKAGKTYVPLDPFYPRERLLYILDDSQAQAIVTNNQNLAYAEELTQGTLQLVNLDRPSPLTPLPIMGDAAAENSSPLPLLGEGLGVRADLDISPDALAYILYTSGSTGQPKGVMQSHRNVLHFMRTYTNNLHISATDKLTLLSSYSFDAAIMDIFAALLNGATLYPFDLKQNTLGELVECLIEEDMTIYHSTPTVYRHLINTLTGDEHFRNLRFDSLRLIVMGGEAVYKPDVESYKKVFSDECLFVNGLGPTESTVTLQYFINKETELTRHAVPVGYPVDNTEILLLNEAGQETDTHGEIAILSEHVALGYWRKEEKSAAAFLSDWPSRACLPALPLTPLPILGEGNPAGGRKRLYRMGDLGRYLPDGSLEFVGRKDTQVKIRGYRIELGEVESALSQHPAVSENAVIVWPDAAAPTGNQQLVAYVVSSDPISAIAPVDEWRDFMRQKLPEYMVPQAYIQLEALPQTPTGKIDRRALPTPDLSGLSRAQKEVVAPRTPTEELLAVIWGEILQVSSLGIHDNFFELGGHSLLAVQIISRVRQTFKVDLPLRCLFESPTIAGFSRAIQAANQAANQANLTPIVPIPRDIELPLSATQLRLWLLMQLEGENATYKLSRTLRLVGELDQAALRESFREVVRRHESLRTTFSFKDGQPKQVIHDPESISLPVMDLSDLPEREQKAAVLRLAHANNQAPFSLSAGPLLRVTLLKLATKEHLLLITMHHIISDAWSMRIFLSELSLLYEAALNGQPSGLAELPIQYADFAGWQQQTLQGEFLEKQLSYWKEHLAGQLPVLELPRDYARPTEQTFTGGTLSIRLSEALSEALASLSRQEGSTLFMTLLAAFKTLLYRYTGQEDIIVGTPIAGRNRAELEGLIGFFLNTLVLRNDFEANPTFRELLGRVREVALSAYAHQDIPFEKLLQELQPERDLSRTPIFQVWVNMLPANQPLELAGLTVESVSLFESRAKFDLSLYISAEPQIELKLVYNADLFSEARIQLMLTHLQTLLAGIVAAPDAPISSYRLPPARGRNLVQPSNPFIEFPYDAIEQSIPSRFAEQVSRYPDNLAIKTKRYAWTYHQLNEQANHIAQAILDQESGAGRIALLFEHDAPMIAGMLGVLKAGKTYVALDPFYPRERLLYILEDSQAQAIVTNNQNIDYAWALSKGTLQLINLDRPSPLTPLPIMGDAAAENSSPLPLLGEGLGVRADLTISPDALAYILYTSGSTGQPKGVMQSHRNVLHFMRCYTNNLHISATDKLTLLSSYSFDAAIMDIFGALLNGATLYPFDLKQNTLGELVECLIEEDMTIYHSTPTVYRHLINTLTGDEQFPHLRLVVMGGEAVYKPDVESYKKVFNDECLFVNGLGPTESTVTLQYFINKETELTRHAVPVGYPVDNTEILLLNEAGQETDIYGEIAILSSHVALGYWRKEEKSATAFFPDWPSRACLPALPLTPLPILGEGNPAGSPKRLYRMGDLGRYLPDGSLEFVGRKDTQVKIRGYRIELGEVESALSQHPAVEENAVIVWPNGAAPTGNQQLVAYVVCSDPQTRSGHHSVPTVDELRDFMRQKLPSYMVPQVFVYLEALPQTPTGKVDRRALPAPDLSGQTEQKKFVAPRTPTEKLLAETWQEALQVPEVGIHDNFFELGGHSLLAVQVISRMRAAFSVNFPLRYLFENPTIAELSKILENLSGILSESATQSEADPNPIMPPHGSIVRTPRDRVLPLSFGQQRLWDWQQLAGEGTIYRVSYFRVLKGALNLVALEQSFSELVSRHENLRTVFPVVGGKPVQRIEAPFAVSLPLIDLRGLSAEERQCKIGRLVAENSDQPFDLAKGPLFRIGLLRLDTQEHLLLLTFHHIIIDGWSRRILFREWSTLYEAFSQDKPSPLPEMSLQYADFAHWQRHTLQGEVMSEQLAYWKEHLGGKIPVLTFPQDYPRPAQPAFRGERQSIVLCKPLSDALKRLSEQEGSTLFMTMLSAFKALLYHKTGQEDIIIGSPNANRTRREVTQVVGYLVNPLAFRTSLQGNPTFRELLRRVRQVVLGAYAHQEIPFEKIVAELHPKRDLNRDPIFAVWFNMLNLEKQPLRLKGLTVEPIELTNNPTAMFDLTLSVTEVDERESLSDRISDGGFHLRLMYKADLFKAERMAQLLAQYQRLLARVAEQPEIRLSDLLLDVQGLSYC